MYIKNLEVRIGQNVAECNTLGWETVYITENSNKKPKSSECPKSPKCPKSPECPKSPKCPKSPECPKSPDCKGEKSSDLSEYQKLANIQYQRDVKGIWISGKDYLLKFLRGL